MNTPELTLNETIAMLEDKTNTFDPTQTYHRSMTGIMLHALHYLSLARLQIESQGVTGKPRGSSHTRPTSGHLHWTDIPPLSEEICDSGGRRQLCVPDKDEEINFLRLISAHPSGNILKISSRGKYLSRAEVTALIAHLHSWVETGSFIIQPPVMDDATADMEELRQIKDYLWPNQQGLANKWRSALVKMKALDQLRVKKFERLISDAVKFAKFVVNHGNMEMWPDHACRKCVGDGEMVKDGFVCAQHRAPVFLKENPEPADQYPPPIHTEESPSDTELLTAVEDHSWTVHCFGETWACSHKHADEVPESLVCDSLRSAIKSAMKKEK